MRHWNKSLTIMNKAKINSCFIKIAALLGVLAVILGAFGAHGLKTKVSSEALAVFEVGVRYQMYHVFALLLTGILFMAGDQKRLLWAGRLFIAGIILFSGSLYALTFAMDAGNPALLKLGIITPLGGLCFIAGWLFLALAFGKKQTI